MRLGQYACELAPGSLAHADLRRRRAIHERHRHRYEFNRAYEEILTANGLRDLGQVARRQVRRDRRAARPPVVHRGAVPPRVQVEAAAAAPAVRQLRRGEPPAQAGAARRADGGARAAAAVGVQSARRPLPPHAPRPACIMSRVQTGRDRLHPRRRRAPARPHRRPVRHRERGARARSSPRDPRHRARAAACPFVFKASYDKANRTSVALVPRPRPRARACAILGRGSRPSSACRS